MWYSIEIICLLKIIFRHFVSKLQINTRSYKQTLKGQTRKTKTQASHVDQHRHRQMDRNDQRL